MSYIRRVRRASSRGIGIARVFEPAMTRRKVCAIQVSVRRREATPPPMDVNIYLRGIQRKAGSHNSCHWPPQFVPANSYVDSKMRKRQKVLQESVEKPTESRVPPGSYRSSAALRQTCTKKLFVLDWRIFVEIRKLSPTHRRGKKVQDDVCRTSDSSTTKDVGQNHPC